MNALLCPQMLLPPQHARVAASLLHCWPMAMGLLQCKHTAQMSIAIALTSGFIRGTHWCHRIPDCQRLTVWAPLFWLLSLLPLRLLVATEHHPAC